jgi:hypothetical protein
MNIFARPVVDPPSPQTRQVRWAFLIIFSIGVGLRGWVSFDTICMIHPDEHQQYLEQAQRYVYGYGVQFWEQEQGLRHPLYSGMLAGPLAGFEAVGVRDPIIQGALLRWLVATLALGAWALFAWEFQRRGNTLAALTMMVLISLIPDLVFIHTHPVSEIAASVPFTLALVWLDSLPFLAGLMLGLSFGIRFQMGFLIAALVPLVWILNRFRFNRPILKLGAGLSISLFALGLSDQLVYGQFYHSPIKYFTANIVDNVVNSWGVFPWYQYFVWMMNPGWAVIVPLWLLLLIGTWREWKLAFLSVTFLIPHMMIGHKEARFLLPVVPLALALVAIGFTEICKLAPRKFQYPVIGLAAACLGLFAVLRIDDIQWNSSPYRPSAELLRDAGQQDDLGGVLLVGNHISGYGNYFYLRRNVPLVALTNAYEVAGCPELQDGRVNYLICENASDPLLAIYEPVPVKSCLKHTLYRLKKPPKARED